MLIVLAFRIQEDGCFVSCVICQVPPTAIQVTRQMPSGNHVLCISLILQDWEQQVESDMARAAWGKVVVQPQIQAE